MLGLISLQFFSQNIEILLHLMSLGLQEGMLVGLTHLLVVRDAFTLHINLVKTNDSLLELLVIIQVQIQDIIQIVLEGLLICILLLDLHFCVFHLLVKTTQLKLHILDNQIQVSIDLAVVLLLVLHLCLLLF